jgi:hypothetical protein
MVSICAMQASQSSAQCLYIVESCDVNHIDFRVNNYTNLMNQAHHSIARTTHDVDTVRPSTFLYHCCHDVRTSLPIKIVVQAREASVSVLIGFLSAAHSVRSLDLKWSW